MQHPRIGHDAAKPPVTFREMRNMADVEAFQPGVTTYDEVVEKLGKPKSQNFAADGSKNVTWIWVQVVPGASQSRATRIAFDKEGKMVRIMSKVE